ncbi:MAG: glycosyltransferase [Thermomonas sp.]
MRTLLFHRDFQGYSGGHGKVWDYFRHVRAHPHWDARIHFRPGSIDAGNPWREGGVQELADWQPDGFDALFLAGMDWQAHPLDDPARPVINLIQGVRHVDHELPLRSFLQRPAIRICVGQPVADALAATGLVHGPILVIDSAVDVDAGVALAQRTCEVFISAQKQPALGAQVAEQLRARGINVDCASAWLPRSEFLARMRQARVAVVLPLAREGFYLPGLEAMASGCAVVMPDAVGNRAYAVPGHNVLMPNMESDALVAATLDLLGNEHQLHAMAQAGIETAAHHGMAQERAALHRILDNLDALWAQALIATSH